MPARPWTVNRPGPLVARADGVWTVDDEVPGLPGAGRRMSVVRRSDGTLLLYNAIPVPEETLSRLRALGAPAQLILPNQFHALDAAAFVEKLGLTAFAPEVALARFAEHGLACRPIGELPTDPALRWLTVEGFRTREVVLLAHGCLMVGDLVTAVPHGRGFVNLMMRLVGFTGPEPKLPRPVRARVARDTEAVRALLNQLADQPGLVRLIPSHGLVWEKGVPAALREVARSLS